jgi:hypothetical protein
MTDEKPPRTRKYKTRADRLGWRHQPISADAPKKALRQVDWEDPEVQRQVEVMAGLGMSEDHISLIVGVHKNTLRTNMQATLELGRARALADVARTAYQMAVSGECPAATFFWLKTQGRWRENHSITLEVEHKHGVLAIPEPIKTVEEWEQKEG